MPSFADKTEGKRRQKKAMQQGKKNEPFPITREGAWASKKKIHWSKERKKERVYFYKILIFFTSSKSKHMDKIIIFSLLQEPIWPHLPSYPQIPTVQK